MFLVGNRQVTRVRGEHDLMNADFWRGTAREIMFRNYAKHDLPHEEGLFIPISRVYCIACQDVLRTYT